MKTSKKVKTIPNGEKIKGNNFFSKYVSKNRIYIHFNEVKVKGRAHSIKAYEVLGQISGKKDEAVIKVSRKGFELTLDKDEISNKEQVLEILEQSIDKLSS